MMNSSEFGSAYVMENPTCTGFIPGKAKKDVQRNVAMRLERRLSAKRKIPGNKPPRHRVSAIGTG
jgi:hypothetical protein